MVAHQVSLVESLAETASGDSSSSDAWQVTRGNALHVGGKDRNGVASDFTGELGISLECRNIAM